uniref:Uncharacterized protein n=1 Tax=Candidozyma auris TaxID=498019 RepID=A0A0L0P0T3_CANAR
MCEVQAPQAELDMDDWLQLDAAQVQTAKVHDSLTA